MAAADWTLQSKLRFFLMCACFSSHFGLASMLQQDSMPTPTLSTKTLSSHKIQEILLADQSPDWDCAEGVETLEAY